MIRIFMSRFRDIRGKLGEIDVCLMPISAWFQRHVHVAPEDAVKAAEDLGCKEFISWGWGIWIISFEHILDPPAPPAICMERNETRKHGAPSA